MTLPKMTLTERKAIFSLSTIILLRILGLFMVVPLFTLYASQLPGATPLLMGLALGIYGLTQAVLQIPFGTLSDYFGRKKIITLGLGIFIAGSVIAALSHDIWGLLIGRALQGAGAVGSTVIALITDLTRPEQRTKAMAIAGITIGTSLSLAMTAGPLLGAWIHVNGIFWLSALFSVIAIILLFTVVPTPTTLIMSSKKESFFLELLQQPELNHLNLGIFFLHLIFTASFVVIPISLQTMGHLQSNKQWIIYLPTLIIGFFIAMVCIMRAEEQHRIKYFFIGGVLTLMIAEFLLSISSHYLLLSALSLLLFFSAFSLLAAFLPSLISRAAPENHKGTALGIYSCSQFLGIFAGGTLGGWLYGALGPIAVYLSCAILAIVWSGIAFKMKNPQYA